MRTPRLPVIDWTDAPADLNGLVRFAKKDEIWFVRVCHRVSNAVYLVEPEVCLTHGGSPRYDPVTAENAKQGVLQANA